MSDYSPEQVLQAPQIRRAQREWIKEYPSVRKLALSIIGRRRRGSPATVNAYIVGVKRFVEFVNYEDPETLLGDILQGTVDVVKLIDEPGDGFIDTLLETYANKTVHRELYGVKKWLEVNEADVNWKKVEAPTTTVTFEIDRAPTKKELRLMLDNCMQLKDRVALLVLSSSGLRVGTFLSLKWGDVSFDYPDVARITVRRAIGRKFSSRSGNGQASPNLYVTWITPETRKLLEDYKQSRILAGEKITADTPLFGNDTDPLQHMKISGFHRRYHLILERAGLNFRQRRIYTLHVHTLRKYFRSRCVGVDESFRESWMGHRGGYLDESYFRAEETRHLDEYRKIVEHLSVYEVGNLEEMREKVREVDLLRSRVDQLEKLLMDTLNKPESIKETRKRLTQKR